MDKEMYDFHKGQQDSHWWFRGRRKCIEAFFQASGVGGQGHEILDIGSGFGALVPLLRQMGEVDALEVSSETFPYLRTRGVREIFPVGDFPQSFPPKKYDIVTMFDVLEHIENDVKAVRTICNRLLSEKGVVVVTVPAYKWLWSTHDIRSHHFRRYGRKELVALFKQNGFQEVYASYFMTVLLPLAVLDRLVAKMLPACNHSLVMPKALNALLFSLFASERLLIRKLRLPLGLSLALMGRLG